jgi:hypothetical protein
MYARSPRNTQKKWSLRMQGSLDLKCERRKLVVTGLARWQDVLATELPKANRVLEAAGLPPLKTE